MGDTLFWERLDALVARHRLVVDRPRASAHPRYPEYIYPLDYGYLEGTLSGDREGIDVWIGSLGPGAVTGFICTIDAEEQDVEIKLLIGCTREESQQILADHNRGMQSGLLVIRE